MKPTRYLGSEYMAAGRLDVNDRRVAIWLNLLGIALLFVFGWVFLYLLRALRPAIGRASIASLFADIQFSYLLLTLAAILIIHELIHGLFFWLFTGSRPRFGYRLVFAYASAPDWYLPRNQFIVTGMAPILVGTLAGFGIVPLIPDTALPYLFLAIVTNAAGAVGDLVVVGWLLAKSPTTMVRDTGLKIALYGEVSGEIARMQERWLKLAADYGMDQEMARDAFRVLYDHYSEKDRHYHNLEHLQDVFDVIDELQHLAKDLGAIQLAAWYHDLIYDPRRTDNESRSAAQAKITLTELGISDAVAERVSDLILATKSHTASDGDVDCQILLDADLAPLGASEETFKRHSQAVRREYSWVPEDEYRASRIRLLRDFLEREHLFYTEQLSKAREKQARSNLTRAIAALS